MSESTSPNTVVAAHGTPTRGMTPESLLAVGKQNDPGKFGRMFGVLPGLAAQDAALLDLARAMIDRDPFSSRGDNPAIPAGYTYLGQFVDHDITLDLTPLEAQHADPFAVRNFRTPALDLDSIYGPGPALAPYLYQRDARGRVLPKLLIGQAGASPDTAGGMIPGLPNDLPRNRLGRALLGDERNDENLLVAQTHLLFLKFHNTIYDRLAVQMKGAGPDEIFDQARRLTRWHYQWIVLFDLAERLTEPGLVRKTLDEGRRFFHFGARAFMPAEFSGAAYRLGHSMVRETYNHNRLFRDGAPFEASLDSLFHFSGKSGAILGDDAADAPLNPDLPGVPAMRTLPSNWVTDWRRYFDVERPPNLEINPSRRIDPYLTPALASLPGMDGQEGFLALRNLRRGVQIRLPSGQDIAAAIGAAPLSPADIATGPDGTAAEAHGLHIATPLWYYVLKEAAVLNGGMHLGPVGGTIVAETLVGLVEGDEGSFLCADRNWRPELPSAEPGSFTMNDLLAFVDDINPVG